MKKIMSWYKKIYGTIVTYVLYYAGHIISLIINALPDDSNIEKLYKIYNWFMIKSVEYNDKYDVNFWKKPEVDDKEDK